MIQQRRLAASLPIPWRDARSRQRVTHSAAQFTAYFLLGLTVVSLLIWLNLLLASKTAALKNQIENVQAQCTLEEQKIAEAMREIASHTSLPRAASYARSHGYTSRPHVVYLSMTEVSPDQSIAAAQGSLVTAQ